MNKSPGNKDFKVGGWGARGVLITCSLLYLVNNMDRYVLAVVIQPMKEALGLTDAQAGSLQTVFFLGMMAFSLPVSYLIDRWSRRKAIAVMAIVWSAFTFITGLGKSYLGVLVPRTIVGVGEAAFAAGGTAWITGVYPPESRGRVLGIFNMLMVAGASLGFVLGGLISKRMGGWQYPFFVFAIPGVLLGILAFFMRDYRTVRHVDDRGNEHGFAASVSMLLKIPTLRWLYTGFGLRSFVNWALLSWLTAYFMRSRGIAEDEAGLAMGAIALMSIFGPAIGGVLADRWHNRNPKGRMLLLATSDLLSAVCAIAALLLNVQGAGYLLMSAFRRANDLDDQLAPELLLAYHERLGYLTACPTNLGTGMRVSVLIHRPGLVHSKEIHRLLESLRKLSHSARGLYGEGSEVMGNFFQLSNSAALGTPEEVILKNLREMVVKVITYERRSREMLLRKARRLLEDKVWRAYGLLRYSRSVSTKEALSLISAVRMGVGTGLVTDVPVRTLNELLVYIQPAHLQKVKGAPMDPQERDVARAEYIREALARAS